MRYEYSEFRKQDGTIVHSLIFDGICIAEFKHSIKHTAIANHDNEYIWFLDSGAARRYADTMHARVFMVVGERDVVEIPTEKLKRIHQHE